MNPEFRAVRQACAPSLEKGPQPFLSFLARAQPRGDLRRLLPGRSIANQTLGFAHRLRPCPQQLGEHAVDGGIEIVGDLLDQADP
jgi:hypothetical protein